MGKDPSFRLTKWYLDCVSAAGDTAIFYAAHVSWRALRLQYSSLLCRMNGLIASETSMRAPFPKPCDEDTLAIEAPQFSVRGTWYRSEPPIEKTLFASAHGAVHWNCVLPKAAVELNVGEESLKGLGYAECLTLTIPPWRLPLHRLQWGRWLSPGGSLIWIDWAGPHTAHWTWLNGCEHTAALIAPDGMRLDNAADLQLDRAVTLRDGRLGQTVLRGAPLLARVFPRSMFGICETKWLSSGTLAREGTHENGWAIHEVVQWTK